MAENTSVLWMAGSMEPALNEQERALRDLFASEYVKDFDPVQACQRVGFQFSFAVEFAKRFMSESYVQCRIADLQRATPANEAEQAKQDKALVLSVLRQAAQNGPYASRVMAAAKIASILGLDSDEDKDAAQESNLIEAFKQFATKAPV